MKTLTVVLLVLIVACGGGSGWTRPNDMAPMPGVTEERVIDRRQYLDIEAVPNAYRRVGEDPIAGQVFLLFSDRGNACMVDDKTFVMATDGDNWPCRWRQPRGIN